MRRTLARFEHRPDAEKTDERRYEAASKVVKTFDTWGHGATVDAARLYLSHPHWRAQEMLSGTCGA